MDPDLPMELMSSPHIFNGFCCAILLIPLALYGFFRESQFPLVNGSRLFEFGKHQSRKRFSEDAAGLIQSGLRKAKVFRLMTQNGPQIVLDQKFALEIRNHPGLGSTQVFLKECHAHIAGFEVFTQIKNEGMIQEVVRTKITRNLGKLTEPLAAESSLILQEIWSDKRDWHAIALHETLTHMIAQLSALVFVGNELRRNKEWHIAVLSYAENVFLAAQQLNLWPKAVRPIVARFNPVCRNLRQQIARARAAMSPVLQERAVANEAGLQKDYQDALQWVDEIANGRKYDPVLVQLTLAVAAIHTSSDLLCQALYYICSYEHQETLVQKLREEIISAIRNGGWAKGALQKLTLMDSVLKESQRLKPVGITGMARYAAQKVELSDGTIIPKGTFTLVANFSMCDTKSYPNPATFDPYRFLRRREAGDSSAYLVSPSPQHLGFGLGKHSCPGRFFAANEIKILLCHILLKYDIKSLDGSTPTVQKFGTLLFADLAAKIAIRRRQEEISLDDLEHLTVK